MASWIKTQQQSSPFFGSNASWLESFYDEYLLDRANVSEELRTLFDNLTDNTGEDIRHLPIIEKFAAAAQQPLGQMMADAEPIEAQRKEASVLRLVNSFRVSGHKVADVDPINYKPRADIADLHLSYHNLSDADLDTEFNTGSLIAPDRLKLRDILDRLKRTYTKHVGYEYMHINAIKEREWLQQRIEKATDNFPINNEQKHRLLQQLTKAEGMEKYLHTKYVGQKRFSLEGGDTLIPQLNELVLHLGQQGIKEIVIGMAHRGRLNVLVNLLGKSASELFKEFEGNSDTEYDNVNSGDVKYHMGFSSDLPTDGGDVHVALAFNPSHLEIINPVVLGSAKARQFKRDNQVHGKEVFPILIHGDAAIEGQGVNMELFNMSNVDGYHVGGTMHIVINNQIGFTTTHALDQDDKGYCTEVAKMVQAPIFHVNADDPEAVTFVTTLAADYRKTFKKDVVIDLVCYRRHGHNEADEPSATQPHMYKLIKKHPTTRTMYADKLINEKVTNKDQVSTLIESYRDALDHGKPVVELSQNVDSTHHVNWTPYLEGKLSEQVETHISKEMVTELSEVITSIPEDFKPHNRINKIYQDRIKMMNGDLKMDWGFAETMAYASILKDGYQIRIDGQDSQRGTFFHRHAVIHNVNENQIHMPLAALQSDQARISIINSVLSEEAVLAFEYGYSTSEPNALIVWEAQFGDFANGAQVVIDQFIASGEAKWGRFCGLVMFLPHGYEGQGPEHSSARLERYLQLCAVGNMQVCMPSTPAQMFHMLRRQMLRKVRKPLIVMTPKSLLRYKGAASDLSLLSEGAFQEVIPDRYAKDNNTVERVIICSGKVYYDILNELNDNPNDQCAVIRVEQLYPFPRTQLQSCLSKYPNMKEVVWCQEEPINQGAWFQIRHHLQYCILNNKHGDRPLYFAGRHQSPSPAVGSHHAHIQQQNQLVKEAISGVHGSSIDAE